MTIKDHKLATQDGRAIRSVADLQVKTNFIPAEI